MLESSRKNFLFVAKPIPIDTSFARANMRDMLKEVCDKKMRFQIERYGKALAVLISYEDYLKFVAQKKSKKKGKK